MGNIHPARLAGACLATVAATMTVATPARAAEASVVAYTSSGERVAIGTVVARGVLAGSDGCTFPEPGEVLLATPGSRVAMTTMPDCRMVVTELGTSDGAGQIDRVPRGPFLPAVDEAIATTADPASSGDDTVQHVIDDAVATAGDPMDPRWGKAWYLVLDGNRNYVSDVRLEVRYDRNQRTGTLHNAAEVWSGCYTDGYPTTPGIPGTDLLVTHRPVWCAKHLTRVGPDVVEMNASGVFSRSVLGVEQVRYRLKLRFVALKNVKRDYLASCPVPEIVSGRWPRGWEAKCEADEPDGFQ